MRRAHPPIVQIFQEALRAVDPAQAVREVLRKQQDRIWVGNRSLSLRHVERIWVLGAGKASAAMAQAVEAVLGDRIHAGLVLVKDGHRLPLRRIRVMEASHPVPDARGLEGTRALIRMAREAGPRDVVFCLLSGGGSALLVAPGEGIRLAEKQRVHERLLACGAAIHEINTVRKHLSRVKGGHLAVALHPARSITLVVSDVVGDRLDVVASGPTVPDPTTYGEAWCVLERYGLLRRIPRSVRDYLQRGLSGTLPETPKPHHPAFRRTWSLVVASNRAALEAAARAARQRGFRPLILTALLQGEAREAARVIAAVAQECARSGRPVPPPAALLWGGETTVTLGVHGLGGRNQELALAAALELAGCNRIQLLAAGTDGTDGPTDAAGAWVDGSTVPRARRQGLDPEDFLRRHDAYRFFQEVGGHLKTGPTGTNVMDLVIVLVAAPGRSAP